MSILQNTFHSTETEVIAAKIATLLNTGAYVFTNFSRLMSDGLYDVYFLTETEAHYFGPGGKRKIAIEKLEGFKSRARNLDIPAGEIPLVGNICTFDREKLADPGRTLDYLLVCLASTPTISVFVWVDRNTGERTVLTILNHYVKILTTTQIDVGFDLTVTSEGKTELLNSSRLWKSERQQRD